MQTFTDISIDVCPWSAHRDPLVARVVSLLQFFETGQLALAAPGISNRVMEGIAFYKRVDNRVHCMQLDMERETRKREAASRAAEGGGHGRY